MNQNIKRVYLNIWQGIYRVAPKFQVSKKYADVIVHMKTSSDHVFRGYYDIDYFDESHKKFLVHILPKAEENGNCIQIGYYDLEKNEIVKLADSKAWCWQQGSRLRWFDANTVIFNDCDDNRYLSRKIDVLTRKTVGKYDAPLYDASFDNKYGLSLNFSRLQRLRPGYGYKTLKDSTEGMIASENDGIFFVDLAQNTKKLLISLAKLHNLASPSLDGEDYINHICISPKGDSFTFFYIVGDKEGKKSKVYLCWSDVNGSNVKVLEDNVQTSHYTWLDNDTLLTTYLIPNQGMRQGYRLYDVRQQKVSEYGSNILTLDGHPTFIEKDIIITDTYPQVKQGNNQYLRLYDDQKHKLIDLGRFFQDIRYSGEKRCDLHPSICKDFVSVDTSCDGLRSVVLLKRHHRNEA